MMKEKEEFYKIEALVSKKDCDEINKQFKVDYSSVSNIIFNAIKDRGITVFEVSIHSASARIQPKSITLDVSENGESTTKKGFNRYEIE